VNKTVQHGIGDELDTSHSLPLYERTPAFSAEVVPAPVDPARARVSGLRFYHDAAAAFAVMSHKVGFLPFFLDVFLFVTTKIEDTCPIRCA
jgi:hypothetical protein